MEKSAEAKLVLKDFTQYAQKVATAYEARPTMEHQYVNSWKVLISNLKNMYKKLQSAFDFEFTEKDPYMIFFFGPNRMLTLTGIYF